jgi:hypothetical protein
MTSLTASTNVSDGEIDALIAELDQTAGGLPERALRRLQELREAAVPQLIEVLNRATVAARNGEIPAGDAHFFALFLLAEFRAREAVPAVVAAVSLPGELPFDLFGDAITGYLSTLLMMLSDNPRPLFDTLIADSTLSPFVRWQGATGYIQLVRDGRISRGEAVEALRMYLQNALEAKDRELVDALVCELTDLVPVEAMPEIEQAFASEMVDEGLIDLPYIRELVAKGGQTSARMLVGEAVPFTDTVAELRTWSSYSEPAAPSYAASRLDFQEPVIPLEAVYGSEDPLATLPRVGRNDPCLCGSGKKFKKCCGAPRNLRS